MGLHTKAIHAGLQPEKHRGAVSVPIYQSSTFAFPSAEEGAARFAGESEGPIYTRLGNPTVQALEEAVAELENGRGAVATATGMAAVSAVFLAMLKQGDHVVSTAPIYGATRKLIEDRLARLGVASTFVPAIEGPEAIRRAIRPQTRLIYIETPANPTLDLADIEGAAGIGKIPLVVDNTFAGPHLQRPLDLGADVVLHSMTKSLNGHSDVVAGVVVASDPAIIRSVREAAIAWGLTMDPHQAWLVLRGIRTLGMRVERAQANAIEIAQWLEAHPLIEWVSYPGLPSHRQYDLAKKQMSGPGSVLAFELRGGIEAGRVLMNNVRVITLAVSLGGVESLIEHPASMTHKEGVTPGLVRLSVGCEDVDDLRADLAQALEMVKQATSDRTAKAPLI